MEPISSMYVEIKGEQEDSIRMQGVYAPENKCL
jgi:hypothetical protein